MSAERYIVIPGWERFQHYKDRTPLWIKNYTELMSDDAYLGLTLHQRGVLHGLWMEYARARRQIPDSTSTISRRLGERVTRGTLEALNHAGFIKIAASSTLASRYQAASPEKSREENKDRNHDEEPEGSSVSEGSNDVKTLRYVENENRNPDPSPHDLDAPTNPFAELSHNGLFAPGILADKEPR